MDDTETKAGAKPGKTMDKATLARCVAALVLFMRNLTGGLPLLMDAPESGLEKMSIDNPLGAWAFRYLVHEAFGDDFPPGEVSLTVSVALLFRDNGTHCAADFLKRMRDGLVSFTGDAREKDWTTRLVTDGRTSHAGHDDETKINAYVLRFGLELTPVP